MNIIRFPLILFVMMLNAGTAIAATLLTETFDNSSLPGASYVTFDPSIFDASVRVGTSGYSVRWTWQTDEEEPDGVNTGTRWEFTPSDRVYISFYWRPHSDWVGSGDAYHPHLVHIIPELWTSLAAGDLRIYIELSNRQLRLIVGIGGSTTFYDTGADIDLADWTRIECWFVLNTVGVADGIMKVWLDGSLVYSNTAITYRSSADVHMGAIAIAPWISDGGIGSPQQQTLWMDNLTMSDEEAYTGGSSITGISITGGSFR